MNKLELKQIINYSGLSREDFAKKLEISLSTLNSWSYRDSNIPKNKALLIRQTFNFEVKQTTSLPVLKKDNVIVSVDEIFNFILENEAVILKEHKLFKLWISEKVYKGLTEISGKLDAK